MSIIDKQTNEPTAAQRAADGIVWTAKTLFSRNKDALRTGLDLFWRNPNATPHEVADALGTDAVSAFAETARLIAFLEATKPGCTADITSVIGTWTANEDGTVIAAPKAEEPS
jgi:hypothetical protein